LATQLDEQFYKASKSLLRELEYPPLFVPPPPPFSHPVINAMLISQLICYMNAIHTNIVIIGDLGLKEVHHS
jgi:hypothetical protein